MPPERFLPKGTPKSSLLASNLASACPKGPGDITVQIFQRPGCRLAPRRPPAPAASLGKRRENPTKSTTGNLKSKSTTSPPMDPFALALGPSTRCPLAGRFSLPAPQRAGDAERCAVPTAPQLPGRRAGGSPPFPDTLARVSRAAEGARGRVAAGTRAGTAPAERGGPRAASPGSGLAPGPVASPAISRVTGTALVLATGDGLKPLTA